MRGRGRVAPGRAQPPQLSEESEEKTNWWSLFQCSPSFRYAWGRTLNPNPDSNGQKNTACCISFTPFSLLFRAYPIPPGVTEV